MPGQQSRFIKIRVSEDDFRTLDKVCQEKGLRSISDLVREELLDLVNRYDSPTGKATDMGFWFRELVSRLASLQGEVERLEELIKTKG